MSLSSGAMRLAHARPGVSGRFGDVRGVVAALGVVAVALAAVWTGGPAASGASTVASPDGRDDQILEAYANLPVTFVENRGQIGSRVRYYAQGSRYGFFFTPEEVVLSLEQAPQGPGVVTAVASEDPRGVALALRFLEADPQVVVKGQERAPGQVNYLRGNDQAGWHTELSAYMSVVYRELWPGIDAVLREQDGELKYEFLVQPGANPADIRLAYAGADGLVLDGDGGMLIQTPLGELRDSPPVSWQEIGGARVSVDSRYDLDEAAGEYGFALGAYDADRELIIDPGLDYSTFLGGSSMDRAGGVAVDANGNAYVVGTTQSTDFPTTTGAFDRTFNGGITDVFVAKLNASGSGLVYATYLGGTPTPLRRGTGDNVEFGRAIAVDADGHAYITGLTDSSDFPTTAGAFQPSINVLPLEERNDARDAFVTKLNASGSGLVYSTFLGGTGFDDGQAIAVDASGNAYVVGDTDSNDFPTTSGAAQSTRGGGRDAFATKLNAAGSNVVYSTYLGGADNEVGNGVAVDASGNAYVVGGTRSDDFPTTAGAFQPTHNGGAFTELFDAYVTKLNASGALVYSTFLGGSRIETASGVDVDAAGNAYVVGSTSSEDFPTTAGAFNRTSRGSFVTKLNTTGSALVYSTFLAGGGSAAIALDADSRAWVTGSAGASAPTTPDAFARENSGGSDAWLGQLNADGSALEFATFIGGSTTDNGADLALDGNEHVYVAGTTLSFDFPTTVGAFDNTFDGDPLLFWGDAFIAKFGAGTGTVQPPPTHQTDTFSGQIDKNQTRTHTLLIGATGAVDVNLDWDESRANLTLRVRDPDGAQVFFAGGNARPKTGTFEATRTGQFTFEVANTTNRRSNYTLSVSHPHFNSFPASVSLLTLDPATVTGGTSSTGRVSLTAAAPSGGATVALTSSNTAAATVPATVTVPAGLNSATFTVSTSSVSANTTSTITASYNSTSRTATLGINAADGPAMSTLTLNPNPVSGGSSSTGTATLTAPAPSGGAVVTLGSSNTDVATVPASVTVPAGQTSATFTVSTSPQQFNQSSAISASHGGVTRSVTLSVTAGSAPTLSSLSLSPTSVTGGNPSTGTVTLTAAAPLGGLVVELSSSNTAAATVPASVTVGSGSTSATFTVSTSSVSSSTSATITGTGNGVTRSAELSVNAVSTSPTLSSLALNPTTVLGGSSSTGTVTLTAAAPSGGASVSLSSNNIWATVPSSVTVPAGSTSATFTVSTTNPDQDTVATITGSHGGSTRTASLNITRAGSSTTTTTFSGRIRDETITHTVSVGAAGRVDYDLRWDESRVDLTLRVRDPAGATVLLDATGGTRSTGSFDASAAGGYRFEIINPIDRRTDYTLSVTHPSG